MNQRGLDGVRAVTTNDAGNSAHTEDSTGYKFMVAEHMVVSNTCIRKSKRSAASTTFFFMGGGVKVSFTSSQNSVNLQSGIVRKSISTILEVHCTKPATSNLAWNGGLRGMPSNSRSFPNCAPARVKLV
jgi:hypothetical protein